MPTKLSKPIQRETAKRYGSLPVIVTLAPARGQAEALIGLRLKGQRTQYVAALSDVYRMAALWHGQKLAAAKRAARKAGVSWPKARKKFIEEHRASLDFRTDEETLTTEPTE